MLQFCLFTPSLIKCYEHAPNLVYVNDDVNMLSASPSQIEKKIKEIHPYKIIENGKEMWAIINVLIHFLENIALKILATYKDKMTSK